MNKTERKAKTRAKKERGIRERKKAFLNFSRIGGLALNISPQEFYVLFHLTVMADEQGNIKITAQQRYQLFLDSTYSGKEVKNKQYAGATISQNITKLIKKGYLKKVEVKTFKATHAHTSEFKKMLGIATIHGWKGVKLQTNLNIYLPSGKVKTSFKAKIN